MGIAQPTADSVLFRAGQGRAIYEYLKADLPSGDLLVIEVGAGTGAVLREFERAATSHGRSVKLVGCEYASAYVEVARSNGTDVRRGGIETIRDIPSPDVLILSHVLEHLPDPVGELRAIRTMINRDCLVYVEVPGLLTLHRKSAYNYDLHGYLTIAHTYHFTLATLATTMARGGFRLLRGDEEARGVFVADDLRAMHPPVSNPDELVRLVRYLDHLQRSRRLGIKRMRNRAWRPVRSRLRGVTIAVLGERRARRLYARLGQAGR
jgi:SAM-dependent methyltransferase